MCGSLGMGSFSSVGSAFSNAKKSSTNLTKELGTLNSKINNACMAASLDASSQKTREVKKREETKTGALSLAYDKLDELITDAGVVDEKVSVKVNELKNDFYKKYSYLKPESEKSRWEKIKDGAAKIWDGICDISSAIADFAADVFEWCKENWVTILKVVAIAVMAIGSIILLCTGVGAPLAAACWGCLIGMGSSFLFNGVKNVCQGKNFFDGAIDSLFYGGISGAISGALGGFGSVGGLLNFGESVAAEFAVSMLSTAGASVVTNSMKYGFDKLSGENKIEGGYFSYVGTNLGVDLLFSAAAFGVGKGIDNTFGKSSTGSKVMWHSKDKAAKNYCELTVSGFSKELVSNVFGGIGEIASDSPSSSASNSSNQSKSVLDNSLSDFKIDNSLNNFDFSQDFNFNSNIDIDININLDLNISIDLKGLCVNYLNTVV